MGKVIRDFGWHRPLGRPAVRLTWEQLEGDVGTLLLHHAGRPAEHADEVLGTVSEKEARNIGRQWTLWKNAPDPLDWVRERMGVEA